MGNATHRAHARPKSRKNAGPDRCTRIVNWSITALIAANLLFLGQKIPVPSWIAKPRTAQEMARTARALDAWRAKHGDYPLTLGEMMVAPEVRAIAPNFHDASGNRLQYIRTGYDRYILRSFGSDAVPATSHLPNDDMMLESPDSRHAGGMIIATKDAKYSSDEFATWPPAASEGLWSPDGHWLARITTNPRTAEKRIVVVNDDHDRILVSPHDRVEEFTWEQGAGEPSLVFTATGSELYDDGIYRWRLSANQPGDAPKMENLIESRSMASLPGNLGGSSQQGGATATGRPRRWVLALLQSTGATNALAIPEDELLGGGSGTPRRFFDATNILICPPGAGKCVPNARVRGKSVKFRIALDQEHATRGTITPGQRLWARLPSRGKSGELLREWNRALDQDGLSAMRPYVIFFSIILHDQLRAKSGTLATRLLQGQETPRYLQALIVGADRPSLKSLGPDARAVFELTDTGTRRPGEKASNGKR